MPPRIFRSDLTGSYYLAYRVKDMGNGNFMVVGKKIDVTKEVEAAILQSELIQKAAKATALPKFPNERIAPSRLGAMEDFNNTLKLRMVRMTEELTPQPVLNYHQHGSACDCGNDCDGKPNMHLHELGGCTALCK